MRRVLILAALCLSAACGGSGDGPTTLSRPTSPQVNIQVAPNPLSATMTGVSESGVSFRISATVTFKESRELADRSRR